MKRMNKKGQLSVGGVVILFMGIIAALALFTPIIDTVGLMNNKQSVSNQSISTVNAYVGANEVNESINFSIYSQSAWKVIDCPLTSVAIRNGAGTALTSAVDYTLDADNGRFSLLNTSKTVPATALNLTYADYSYCADGYNKDSSSRSINGLILIFCALIIVAFVLEYSEIIDLGLIKR